MKKYFSVLLFVLMGFSINYDLLANERSANKALVLFDSNKMQDRMKGFYSLLDDNKKSSLRIPNIKSDDINFELIKLLEKEGKLQKYNDPGLPNGSEEYGGYIGDLVGVVSALKDKRSLNALLYFMNTGQMATDGIMAHGVNAVDALVKKINSSDSTTRLTAIMILSEMYYGKKISDNRHKKEIINALSTVAQKDLDLFIRMSAVEELENIGKDAISELNKIEHFDDYSVVENGIVKYPIRERATKAINKLQNN